VDSDIYGAAATSVLFTVAALLVSFVAATKSRAELFSTDT
jgi:hypothetical protein